METADGRRVRIVGVVEPLAPDSDAWWGTLLPFRYLREARNGASMPETISLSLLVRPEDMQTAFPGHTHEWRLLTDTSQITLNNSADIQAQLREVETQLVNNFLRVDTSLLDIIGAYEAEIGRARVSLFLLAAQSLLFGLLALLMVGGDLIGRGANETRILGNRGISRGRLTLLFGGATFLLALAAVLLAPWLARVVLSAWGAISDRTVVGTISRDAWVLDVAAVFAGWLLLTAGFALAVRRLPAPWSTGRTLAPQRPWWQRYYLDLILLLAGAALYWQSVNSGGSGLGLGGSSFSGGADPLLLLGPTFLLAGLALLFLRLYPPFIRWFSGREMRGTAVITPYSLTHAGRAPVDTARLILVISLATGLAVFATLWQSSLAQRQAEMAHAIAGADVRVGVPNTSGRDDVTAAGELAGVEAASPVYLNTRTRWAPELTRLTTLVAVDPDTLADVSRFAPNTSNLTLPDILPAIETAGSQAIPAVFSYDTYPLDRAVGDIVTYIVGTDRVDFEVRGLIRSFPAVDGAFMVTNLELLEQQVDLSLLSEPWIGQKEIWLQVAPGMGEEVEAAVAAGQGPAAGRIITSTAAAERRLRSDLVGQQTAAALSLNGWSVAVLSIGAFGLLLYFAARRRDAEFSVLETMGYAPRQIAGLLAVEGVTALVLGLLAGIVMGYALAVMMRPLLSSTLSAAVGGDTIHAIVINWGDLLTLLGLLTLGYSLALMIVITIATRRETGVNRRAALE